MLEVAQPHDAVLVLVDGTEVVAGDGMGLQGVVNQVCERLVQGVVDEQSPVTGEYPGVAVAQVENPLHAVVLYVLVIVQVDVLPLQGGVALVQQQAVLEGIYPQAFATVYVDDGLFILQQRVVGDGQGDFPGFGRLLADAVKGAVGVHYIYILGADGYIGNLLRLQGEGFDGTAVGIQDVELGLVVCPELVVLGLSYPEDVLGGYLLLFEHLLVVVVELPGVVVVYTISIGHPYPYIAVHPFEYLADGIIRQFRVVAVVSLEGVAVVLVKPRFGAYPQETPAIPEYTADTVVGQPFGGRELLEHDGGRSFGGISERGSDEAQVAYKDQK